MTAHEHKKKEAQAEAEKWVPKGDKKLKTFIKEMEPFKLCQEDVPFRIKLFENPRWFTSEFFSGAVNLFTHDCIHIVLGRGLLIKDEAFVIGYTMGSSKRISRFKKNLFMFCSKYLYPEGYRFSEEERFVFNMGILAGSLCPVDLSRIDFKKLLDLRISEIREKLRISCDVIKHCYGLEGNCFSSPESKRLLS